MKIYNPFKPHIIQTSEGYLIRKLMFFIWVYRDKTDNLWWCSKECVSEYCIFKNPLNARIRLIEYKMNKQNKKEKKSKFISQ